MAHPGNARLMLRRSCWPVHELAEVVEHEVGVLQPVDLVGTVHRHRGIERQPFHALAIDRVLHLGGGRQDAGAVGFEPVGRADQAEFDREPVEARQEMHVEPRFDAAPAVLLHVIGEHGIGQQRHVAIEVVEQVGLDQIIDLLALADPHRDREAAMGEMVVEGRVGNQPGHADDAPARPRLEAGIDLGEVGDGVAQPDRVETGQEFGTGISFGQSALALDQKPPHGLFLVGVEVRMLRHGPVRRHAGIVAAQVLEGGDAHGFNMEPSGW